MRAVDWVSPYPREIREFPAYSPAIDGSLERSRDYAQRFGGWLHGRLSGRRPPDRGRFELTLRRYADWHETELPLLSAGLAQLVDELHDWDTWRRLSDELTFHRLNSGLIQWWRHLLYPDGTSGRGHRDVELARTITAVNSIELLKARRVLMAVGSAHWAEEHEQFQRWLDDSVTELDALVAALEYVVEHPHSVVLPAPPQFSSAAGQHRVDLVVHDPVANQALGIRVRRSGADDAPSQAPRAIEIDGGIHLANRRMVRTGNLGRSRRVVSRPGQLCAHHLLQAASTTGVLTALPAAELDQLQQLARLHVGTTAVDTAAYEAVAALLEGAIAGLRSDQ